MCNIFFEYEKNAGRGLHPKNVVADEADFSPWTLLTVILPLLSETDVVLFALSSPNVAGSVYTNLVFAKDENGMALTNSVILGDPCDVCRSTANPEQCTHKLGELASWKDPARMNRLREIYTAIGREDVYRAELSTMGTLRSESVFSRDMYIGFLTKEPFSTDDKISSVFIGVDPAYGGACEFAVVAVGLVGRGQNPGLQLLAVCSEKITAPKEQDRQIEEIVDAVMSAIRKHPRIGDGVPVVVAIEACASDGTFIGPRFLRHEDVLVLTEFSDESKFGVPKSKETLSGMIGVMRVVLTRDMLTIPDDAVAVSTSRSVVKMTMARLRQSLAVQFSNFRLDEQTGKVNGKTGGANDDKLIALMTSIFWMTKFMRRNTPDYVYFRGRYDPRAWGKGLQFSLGW